MKSKTLGLIVVALAIIGTGVAVLIKEMHSNNDTASTAATSILTSGQTTAYGWGANDDGQLKLPLAEESTPQEMSLVGDATQVVGGESHTAYLTTDGKVFTFGGDELHQLGRGDQNVLIPSVVTGLPTITSIATSYRHMLALATDGSVYAWGSNYTGQIGNGTNTNAKTPVKVSGLLKEKVTAIAAGYKFSLALTESGDVYGWGATCAPLTAKKVPDGDGDDSGSDYYDPVISPRVQSSLEADCLNEGVVGIKSKVPKKLDVSGVQAIAAGYGHGLILKKDGTVWSFGCNLFGQLGNRGTTNSGAVNSTILQVEGLSNIVAISAGFRHSVALAADGTVYTWGGQISDAGGDTSTMVPSKDIVKVSGISKIVKVIAGKDYTLAVDQKGKLYGWGSNTNSIITTKKVSAVVKPTRIDLPVAVSSAAAGSNFIITLGK